MSVTSVSMICWPEDSCPLLFSFPLTSQYMRNGSGIMQAATNSPAIMEDLYSLKDPQ